MRAVVTCMFGRSAAFLCGVDAGKSAAAFRGTCCAIGVPRRQRLWGLHDYMKGGGGPSTKLGEYVEKLLGWAVQKHPESD